MSWCCQKSTLMLNWKQFSFNYKHMKNKFFLGSLAIVVAALLWSLDGTFLRPGLFSLPSPLLVFLEHLLGFVVLAPFLFIYRTLLKEINKKSWAAIFWVALFGGALGTTFFTKALFATGFVDISVVILLQKFQPIFAIILAAIFTTLTTIFYIFSNYKLDVSVFIPLFNFRGVFAVLIGIGFFGEKLSTYHLLFVALIIIAGIFSSMDEKFSLKSFFNKTIAIGLLTALFLTLENVFVKVTLADNSLWTTNMWIAILNFFLLIPTIPLFKKELKNIDTSHVLPVAAMGIFSTISGFAANFAYKTNLGITALIMNIPVSMIFAFMFSIFAPKLLEKHTLKIYAIRFSSAAVMIWAAMQLTR